MVLFRLLQGAFGAALVPLSQATMLDLYPLEQRGSAMALWGMGVMVGPILGPTLGGYLTDVYDWRWVFFINLPIRHSRLSPAWWRSCATTGTARKCASTGSALARSASGSARCSSYSIAAR